MISDENYINIQAFMVKSLKLKGNELIIYAIIYGFSQDGESWFSGSRQYLAEWCNISKQSVQSALNSLVNKGYLAKREKYVNNVKYCEYQAKKLIGSQKTLPGVVKKLDGGSQKTLPGAVKNFDGGSQKTLPNITRVNYIENSIETHIADEYVELSDSDNFQEKETQAQNRNNKKPSKHKHGEYNHVLLTDDEYGKLCMEYGEEKTEKAIKYLDEYIEMKGYKAKSHYLCMKKWVFGAVSRDEAKQSRQKYQHKSKTNYNSYIRHESDEGKIDDMEGQLLRKSMNRRENNA